MHKTVLVKLEVADAEKTRLQATFSDYKQAWQSVSDYVFANDCRNRQKVHHATYREVRKGLPSLPSALVQEARNDAIGKAKSVKSNGHRTDFYSDGWTREPHHPWAKENAVHRYEVFTLQIHALNLAIQKYSDRFAKAALIEDGNNFYKNVSKFWQYEPLKSWQVEAVEWGAIPS
jgi:predicted transposase